jgi:hypothetical protein
MFRSKKKNSVSKPSGLFWGELLVQVTPQHFAQLTKTGYKRRKKEITNFTWTFKCNDESRLEIIKQERKYLLNGFFDWDLSQIFVIPQSFVVLLSVDKKTRYFYGQNNGRNTKLLWTFENY